MQFISNKNTPNQACGPLSTADRNIRHIVNHFSSSVEISELFFDSLKYSPSLYICLKNVNLSENTKIQKKV